MINLLDVTEIRSLDVSRTIGILARGAEFNHVSLCRTFLTISFSSWYMAVTGKYKIWTKCEHIVVFLRYVQDRARLPIENK